jgi:hypothetical protein
MGSFANLITAENRQTSNAFIVSHQLAKHDKRGKPEADSPRNKL